jgi:prophage tail gpP-like protein
MSSIIDPNNTVLARISNRLQLNKVELFIDDYSADNLVFTGYIMGRGRNVQANNKTITFSGWSLTGSLNNDTIPNTAYPLQNDGLSLKQITDKILGKLNLQLSVNSNVQAKANEVFETAQAEPSDIIISYLSRLAQQKNIVIGNTATGKLLFTDYRVNEPVVGNYTEDEVGTENLSSEENAQDMHSEIRVVNQANFSDSDKAEFIIKNSNISAFRQKTVIQTDGDINNAENLAKSIVNSEQATETTKMVITSHRYKNGEIIRPNRVLTLKSDFLSLPERTKLFVRDAILTTDKNGEKAFLTLIPISAVK